jgi:hypothetical protein
MRRGASPSIYRQAAGGGAKPVVRHNTSEGSRYGLHPAVAVAIGAALGGLAGVYLGLKIHGHRQRTRVLGEWSQEKAPKREGP